MLSRSLLIAAACIVATAACVAAGSACSGVRSTDKARGTGGTGGTTMTGQPIGDSGVCFGDPGVPCIVCTCTNCGALTAACETDTACVAAQNDFNGCAQRAPGTDAASLAPCRDAANTASAKAGPYLDCLIASCADKCI
jgi:hypothetical protein